MDFCRKTILLLIFSSFMSVGWGQFDTENYTQEKITISDEEIVIISNYEMEGHTYSDTTYISVSRLLPPCDEGYTEINGECYYQSDLDVLQIFIDNSSETINMDMDIDSSGVIEPLELGEQEWVEGRITYLSGSNIGISGEIPVEIGNLTNLTYLNLYVNQLTGEIPSEIGDLTSLTNLSLSDNQLTGEIPPEIGNLTNLTSLNLRDNQLTGEIPSEIGNLTNLTTLDLGINNFFGEIPSEIENLINVRGLFLSFNNLDGVIPPEFGNLTSLEITYLQYNNFSGELPSEIGNLTNLWGLFLSNNLDLNGEIPESIGNLTNLSQLSLHSNNFDGEIPESIGNLTNLNILRLNDNQLSGIIPEEICNHYAWFSGFDFSNNQFCPPYPECLTEYDDIGNQDTSECCGGDMPVGICDCDGSVWDCQGICGGDAILDDCNICDDDPTNDNTTCEIEAQLSIINVNTDAGTLDIYMINEVDIAGFQFDLSGITLTGVSGGLAGEYFDWVDFNSETGLIMGAAIFTPSTIPAGEGVLTTVSFSDYSDEICFVPNSSVFSDPYGQEILGSLGDCYTPPECDVALGDVSGDGDISILDLVQIAYYILDLSVPDYECAADYNQDGSVDILDLVAIINIILNP